MAVDPCAIRAESHTEIGLLILGSEVILIERWSRRAGQEQPNAQRMHHQDLLDHLPGFLQALGNSLAESGGPDGSAHFLAAAKHGEQRWQTGWSLPEVIRDYQILRLVIVDFLEEALARPLSYRETMAIGLALDDAIMASVARFAKSQDEHLRQSEEKRSELDSQVQQQLRQQAEILRQVDRRKNEFLATLAHELRNPLAPLGNAVRLLELHDLAEPTLSKTRSIVRRQVEQMARLVDDLLDISRITQNKIELRKEKVDLLAVLEQAVQTSAPHLEARNHQFQSDMPAEAIWLEADPIRLVQVVVNLLNNAAKYTQPGGKVALMARREGEEAVIRVHDNGMGIPPDLLPHVFDLFTQAEWPVEPSQGGLGIGLALVRRLVDLHGGTITAHSPGKGLGSEFVVRLPASPAQADLLDGTRQRLEKRQAPPSAKRRILVVDDNVDSAVTLGMILQVDGHEIRLAHDGPTALQTATAFLPEVVLLDIGMPRMDGYEVARRLRGQPETEKLLLVALTGYGQEEDRLRSQESGFNAHLLKPVDLEVLRELLAVLPNP